MPPRKGGQTQPITEHIDELKRKIQLLEGDKKAYYENSEWTVKQNKQLIAKLRKETKELHKMKADRLAADEHVINRGLENHPTEREALRDKAGQVAIVTMDDKVRDRMNILNKHRYQTVMLEKRLRDRQTQYDQMLKDASGQTEEGASKEEQDKRNLDNRLDKAKLKCKEAKIIKKTYEQIKAKLEDEHGGFENKLDDMEDDITAAKQELKELKAMNNDAQIAKDTTKADLEKLERQVYEDRRRRELELNQVRKEAEEKRQQHERIEKRIARGSIGGDDQDDQKGAMTGEEEQQKIQTYEEAFKRIKEATGVSETSEVVKRFENQGETQTHLEEMKKDYERQIDRLEEERSKYKTEFEDMKYSGEAQVSSGQKRLEECQSHLVSEQKRQAESEDKLKSASKTLMDVKSGVDALAEKLKHLKAPSSQVQKAKISPSSDEYVLDQLSQCEEKLLKLLEEIDKHDQPPNVVLEQMEEEDFNNVDHKMPPNNTRIKLPQSQKDNVYDEDSDSGEDEDIQTAANFKKQAKQIIDSKTRKRGGKKKSKSKK